MNLLPESFILHRLPINIRDTDYLIAPNRLQDRINFNDFSDEAARIEFLFELYHHYTAGLFKSEKRKKAAPHGS